MHPSVTSLAAVPAVGSEIVSLEKPDMHPSKTSVTVSLNENRAGGRLSGTDVLCETISTRGSDRGWVKISAEASDERKVEGWLHQVYANMLASKCGRRDLGEEPEVSAVSAVGSDIVSVDEPDMRPLERNVTVSLNGKRAGGRLSGTEVLCGTISTLGADRGWVKISAEASDERKVEGWLHEVYATMLASKCSTSSPPA